MAILPHLTSGNQGFDATRSAQPREGEAMRIPIWLAAVAVTLGLASSGRAQVSLTFGGVNPTQIQNVPITVPDNTPIAQPQVMPSTGFTLTSLLPKISFPTAKTLFGQSIFPTPQNLPGRNYLRAFGYSRPGPIGP
jgi:hypothetical protein